MYRIRKELGITDTLQNRYSGRGITVAVIDTGIAKHPDFGNRVIAFQDFTTEESQSFNISTHSTSVNPCYDDSSHGTHVCGILAGDGTCSLGEWRGIACKCNLVVAKVLDAKGDGAIKNLLRGIEWIKRTKHLYHTRIVNISMGIGELEDISLQEQAIQAIHSMWDMGLVVVVAAGNRGPNPNTISPLATSHKVITVGCYDGKKYLSDTQSCTYYSGRGSETENLRKPDLVTKGTNIISCNSKVRIGKDGYENAYCKKTGTSMATPIVSGVCALCLEQNPTMTNYQLKERLIYTAIDCGVDWRLQGFGQLNVPDVLALS